VEPYEDTKPGNVEGKERASFQSNNKGLYVNWRKVRKFSRGHFIEN